MNDINFTLGNGGLNRQEASTDNVRGLVMGMGAVAPTGLAVNTAKALLQPIDADALGIDAAYDTTNNTRLRYHINEFFAENPNGKLWIYLVAQSATLASMVDTTLGTPCAVEKLATATNGECTGYGIALNPLSTYTPVVTSGLDADVLAAVPKAKALSAKLLTLKMPSHITIEGRSFSGTATAATDLRTLASEFVSICVAQDLDSLAAGANAVLKAHAAIGTILGTSSKAKIGHNIGYVEAYPLMDVAAGRWINPGLSSNLALSSYTATDLDTLNTKGYIFARKFPVQSGTWWNDSHTCTTINNDYYCMENVLAIFKAVRGVYKALQPKINAPLKLSTTGRMSATTLKMLEGTGDKPITAMEDADEVSAGQIFIDPAQNIQTQGSTNIKIKLIAIGTNRVMNLTIGFTTSIA